MKIDHAARRMELEQALAQHSAQAQQHATAAERLRGAISYIDECIANEAIDDVAIAGPVPQEPGVEVAAPKETV